MLRKGKTKAKLSQKTYLFNAHLPNSYAMRFWQISLRQGPFIEEILRERERERGERLRREITLYSDLLQRGRELESNFRVNLIWMGWVNFNLGGFFFIWIGLIFFWVGLFLNGYAMSYPSCH